VNKTKIEWCRSSDGKPGYSWNPIHGCLGSKGDGVRCHYCYAHRLANGRLKNTYLRHRLIAGEADDPFAPRSAGGLLDPMGKRGGRIFVCSMGDLFGDWMPAEWAERILGVAKCCPQHTFLFLTKWPQNLAQFNPWPSNCWVGATATQSFPIVQAARELARVEAPVRYLSIEPLLGPLDYPGSLAGLDWIIVGAQTGPGAKRPMTGWVQEIIDAAAARHIPLFLKDNLHWPEHIQGWPEGKRDA
jgi:protein gp37